MIQFHNVTKRFGPITALQSVTLQIGKGEFLLLTGGSGAGKTTLLRLIYAAEEPDEGQVLLLGKDISRLQVSSIPHLRRAVGVVFQDFKLLRQRTALENVAVALEIRGLPRKEVLQRSREVLELVGLGQRASTVVQLLSGGEQQRIAIARAIAGNPPILLADEPTGNLDPELSHDILDLFDRLARSGITVIVATHDPMVLQNAAFTRAIILDEGAVVGSQVGSRAPIVPPRSQGAGATILSPAEVAA